MGGTTILSQRLTAEHRNRASLARDLDVSKVTLHGWEHGKRRVSRPEVRAALAAWAGAPESELFDEEGRAR